METEVRGTYALLDDAKAAPVSSHHGHSHSDDGHAGHGHDHGHSHGSEGHSHGRHHDDSDLEDGFAARAAASKRARDDKNAQAIWQLTWAIGLCFFFMIAEAVGGYFSGSIAILTDAAHMLSDVASLVIG